MYVLAVVTMVNAAIAAFYYLRVAIYMYMRDPDAELPKLRHGRLVWTGLAVSSTLTIVLGAFPGLLLGIVEQAAAAIPLPPPGIAPGVADPGRRPGRLPRVAERLPVGGDARRPDRSGASRTGGRGAPARRRARARPAPGGAAGDAEGEAGRGARAGTARACARRPGRAAAG